MSVAATLSIRLSFLLPAGREIPVTDDTDTGVTFFWAKSDAERASSVNRIVDFIINFLKKFKVNLPIH
jgi:hypothetical protein